MKRQDEPRTTKRLNMTKARRLRAFENASGICCRCKLPIDGTREKWIAEHIVPLTMQGPDTDENLGVTHERCAMEKTAEEATVRAKVYRVRQRHLGITSPGRQKMPFGRSSGLKKKIGGEVVPRKPKMMPWKR